MKSKKPLQQTHQELLNKTLANFRAWAEGYIPSYFSLKPQIPKMKKSPITKYDIRYSKKDKLWVFNRLRPKELILSNKNKGELMKKAASYARKNHKEVENACTVRICSALGKYQLEWTYPGKADPKRYKG